MIPAASSIQTALAHPALTLAASDGGGLLQRMFFRQRGASDAAVYTDGLFFLIWWFSVFFFVVLMFLMIYWVIKYRRRPGVPPKISPSHHTMLEIIWTVVPSSALLVIFLLGFWGYMKKMVPYSNAVQLDVTGYKWAWEVKYPNGATSQWLKAIDPGGKPYPVFVVPDETPIQLKISSTDVIHSFWIPDFRVKRDALPNRYTGYTFTAPKINAGEFVELNDGTRYPGREHWVFCAEYCGDFHSEMAALLWVVPKATYLEIIGSWNTGNMDPVELGEIVWKQKCVTCHSINGSLGAAPTWKGGEANGEYYGWGYPVTFTDGTRLDARDDNYVRHSILDPQAQIVQGWPGNMPAFQGQLNEDQLNGLIAFYRAQSDRAPDIDLSAEGDAAASDSSGEAAETNTDDNAGSTEPASEGESSDADTETNSATEGDS